MTVNNPSYFCRVCGLNQYEYPWDENNDCPIFGISACCGAEFGYHDCTLAGVKAHRERWLLTGQWSDIAYMPSDWSLAMQIKNIPQEYL